MPRARPDLPSDDIAGPRTNKTPGFPRVTDPSGAVIVGAECKIINVETNVSTTTATNQDGIYVIPHLHPAIYWLIIQKEGFRNVIQLSLQLYVQDAANENFTLAIGPMSESITVAASLQAQAEQISSEEHGHVLDGERK